MALNINNLSDTLDLDKLSDSGESRLRDYFNEAHKELDRDLTGLWNIVPTGRYGYTLKDADLREFIVYAILQLLLYGGRVIEQQGSTRVYWEETQRFGTTPEEIALNVVKEWNAQGEPDPEVWQSIAFAKPEWLASDANERKKRD
jgi:hypothetical protein